MNKKVKAKWVEALRSGKYKQGKDALRKGDNTFCCLGVLCDLHRKTIKKAGWKPIKDGKGEIISYRYLDCGGVPDSKVLNWAGINNDPDNLSLGKLIVLNDNEKKSFKQIAKFIEEKL